MPVYTYDQPVATYDELIAALDAIDAQTVQTVRFVQVRMGGPNDKRRWRRFHGRKWRIGKKWEKRFLSIRMEIVEESVPMIDASVVDLFAEAVRA